MNFIILLLLLYNKSPILPQSFCKQTLFLLVLLFLSSSNSSYLTKDITLAQNNINNIQKHTVINPSFNNKSSKNINSTEASTISKKHPESIPSYKPYFITKNAFSNSHIAKANDTPNVTYDLKHKRPATLNSSKKSNVDTSLIHSKNNKKSNITAKKMPDIISNKATLKNSDNSNINNNITSGIAHRTISDSNICASSLEKNVNKKINPIPNLINTKYGGAAISVIISGLGIITGKVLSNYNNILALKLENGVIVYVNNHFVLNFF